MALMKIFKCPAQTVLYGSPFYKPILVFMHHLQSLPLESVCKKFGDNLDGGVQKGDGPEVIDRLWIILLRNKGNVGVVDALDVSPMRIKVSAKLVYIFPDYRPCFPKK